jgi:outer membrane receptor for ferrienterochelin and colicin
VIAAILATLRAGSRASSAWIPFVFIGLSAVAAAGDSPEEQPPSAGDDLLVVEVKSEKPRQQNLIDRKVYNVSADLQSTTGSVADVLNSIPSVEVDATGVVALRGSTDVLILIDGRPSAQFSGAQAGPNLQQMPSLDIERIEVMATPPPQFKAEGAGGVINIITRKSHRMGGSGSLTGMLGNRDRSVVGANGSFSSAAVSLFGSLTHRVDDRQQQITSTLTGNDVTGQRAVISQNALNEDIRGRADIIKLGADFAFNERQTLHLSFNGAERSGARNYVQTAESDVTPGVITNLSARVSAGTEQSDASDERIVFEQKLRSPEEVLSMTLHRSTLFDRQIYGYTNYFTLPPDMLPTEDTLGIVTHQVKSEFSTDYTLPLGSNRRLKLGYDLETDDDRSSSTGYKIDPITGAVAPTPIIADNFRYLQQVDAAYAAYEVSSPLWSWTGGLRAERTHMDARLLTDGTATERTFQQVFPSLRIERALSDQSTISMSAARRISRPDPSFLDPYIDRRDAKNLKSGNPSLLPQDTQSFELAYSRAAAGLDYTLTGYFRRSRDKVTLLTRALPDGVTLTTKTNLPLSESGGLEFIVNGRITNRVTYGLSADVFYNQIDARSLGAPGLQSTVGVNGKANIDYRPTALDTAQIAFTHSDRRLTPQGYVASVSQVNFGYRRQLSDSWIALLTVSDLFNGQRYRRVVDTGSLTNVYERHIAGKLIYVGFTYSFGSDLKNSDAALQYDKTPQ